MSSERLAWTRAQRKKLRGPLHPHPLDPKDRTPTLDASWRTLVEWFRAGARLRRRPAAGAMPALRESIARVYASFESDALPASFDHADEMARAAIALVDREHPDLHDARIQSALVGLWAQTAGAAFTVELLARESGFLTGGVYSPMTYFELELVLPSAGLRTFSLRDASWWSTLRPYVVALDPRSEAYVAARAAAETVRATADAATRAGCALAFPREPEWAAADAHEWLSRVQHGALPWAPDSWAILASLDDADLAQQLAEAAGPQWGHLAAGYAFDMVDVLGARAAGPLAALLELPRGAPARKTFVAALVLADPGAARALHDHTSNPAVRNSLAAALA
ncbi:hypothetical protein [Sandaracinus amylolyticus]|uniref:Uncharacterized protein n=1 Tax=Sandaracinus amylolyticus TaxID=927083 RepID=A0A0F6W9V0_9BACT|nr:hypothetical protein [Sandaracinus amylolyticus]AKF11131.1 hypothetical protein DB32_008280 [Sandaracinus amylolyticus]